MNKLSEDEVESVARIFVRLGASEKQAKVMSAQLIKQTIQMAETSGISKIEAMERLLKKIVEARKSS